jgi:hypothetical protein
MINIAKLKNKLTYQIGFADDKNNFIICLKAA